MQKLRYQSRRLLILITNNKLSEFLLPSLFGVYILCLENKGENWPIFKDHKQLHDDIFFYGIVVSIGFIIIKGLVDNFSSKGDAEYINFANNLIAIAAHAIESKINRFKECSKNITPAGDTFKLISKPEEQIKLILEESKKLLRESFGYNEDQISITIIYANGTTNKTYYAFDTNPRWGSTRTKAHKLIAPETFSAASNCLKTGEPIFIANKEKSGKSNNYVISERDKRLKNGSVYCYPISIVNDKFEDKYVISIATYGKLLCNESDIEAKDLISTILREVCRRLELELTLYSIKEWKKTN